MGEKVIQKLLRETFPVSDKKLWEKSAISEVDGNETLDKLLWKDADANTFQPYYTQQDTSELRYLENFNRPASSLPFSGNRAWLNMPAVAVTEMITANRQALHHLSAGADGVSFYFQSKEPLKLPSLLNEIQWDYCALNFFGIDQLDVTSAFAEYLSKNKVDAATGNLFWETVPLKRTILFGNSTKFRSLGLIIPNASPAIEICDALIKGSELLANASDGESQNVLANIAFSFSAGTSFLTEIARIKATRILWYQVVRAFGFNQYTLEDLHIHIRSKAWINEKYQPHGNMLKSTTAAMGAIIGGCDSLTIDAEDLNNNMMNRIARNVSSILREESFFDKVADPLAGAYAVQVMTDSLAKKAWQLFQNKQR